jgi:membrane-associated phospholipid phosphatase
MPAVKSVSILLCVSVVASPLLAQVSEICEDSEDVCAAPAESPEGAVSVSDDGAVSVADDGAISQTVQEPTKEPPQEPAPPKEPPPKRPSLRPKDFWRDVKVEAKRYLADSYAIVVAPLHWSGADWTRFGGAVVLVSGLMLADKTIDREVQQNRSSFTDNISDATTGFGGAWAQNIGIGYLLAGYLLRDWNTRETGREILEAGFLSHVLNKYVLKPGFGRERPFESDGETRFHPFSSRDSFPSGHATEAFALASVISIRSKGWVVSTLAYGTAALVAFDRVNDRVHFASDVAAGAILGTAVGRFIVNRHKRAQGEKPAPEVEIVPIPGGLAARVVF